MMRRRTTSSSGQSVVELALVLPLVLLIVFGVIETGYALLDQHIVTKLTREGSNLISRDTPLDEAASAMTSMSTRPVDFSDGSKLVFSVVKRGGSTGTPNYDRLILYQRYEQGNLSVPSRLTTRGSGSFGGAPNYEAVNSDTNINLQLTNVPDDLVTDPGGLIYVTEVFTRHPLLTPLAGFGVRVPDVLYSIAYF